ncbi:hypothetical protein HPB50_021593 [Hyalomma asiaticum]|uniref:Uncharacterized protein n=1 Tax=Hyalomma asiaticum TaxID=266040 RepID=A0ACB7S4P1_HYAAI|nr:hypothetical protein HPB50_021593 [Hyalomma asiaticum]
MPAKRLPKSSVRRTTQDASSSASRTSISETTDQLIAFWQRRFGGGVDSSRGSCSECPAAYVRNTYDGCLQSCSGSTSLHGGGDFQSLLRPPPDDPHRVEYATCSSSTLIFTMMALVSAFLVLSVTVILVRVKPIVESGIQAVGGVAPAAAPRDFTLAQVKPTLPQLQPLTERLPRLDEAIKQNLRGNIAEHTPHKPSSRVPITVMETRETFPWEPAGNTPAGIPTPVRLADLRKTAATTATSQRSSSRGSPNSPSTRVDDTYADEALRMCSVVLYSYCSHKHQEFHFVPANNSCIAASEDNVMVCNHSPNRFTSEKSCRAKCIDSTYPSDRCFTTAIFSRCTSRDVRHQWWFFDGNGCVPWDFPSGLCPSIKKGGDLFNSMAECIAQCVGGESLLQPCQSPKTRPCSLKQLR